MSLKFKPEAFKFKPEKWRESLFTSQVALLYALEEGNILAKNKYAIISQFKRITLSLWKDFQALEEKDFTKMSSDWKNLMKKLENSSNQYKKTKMTPKNAVDKTKIDYFKALSKVAQNSLKSRPLPTPTKKPTK